jgi:magnesium chelatase subunit H
VPNIYLYAANNPSEGLIAKRRGAATLVSHLTPAIAEAGLNRRLGDLSDLVDRALGAGSSDLALLDLIEGTAAELGLHTRSDDRAPVNVAGLEGIAARIAEAAQTLIPEGLHVVGEAMSVDARLDLLCQIANAGPEPHLERRVIEAGILGQTAAQAFAEAGLRPSGAALERFDALMAANGHLAGTGEIAALIHALDGGYTRPAPGGDIVTTPDVLPTGRNLNGFDPFKLPSALAMHDGARQSALLLERHRADTGKSPETVAMVLWGSDNLKTQGGSIAQAMALMGARPRLDAYGRLCGAELVPLSVLGRPRIDVVITLSGIFRDLLALQTRMLAEAAWLAAVADEPEDMNFIRRHALEQMAKDGCDIETAALRVFSNADGAYGANVNQLIEGGVWVDEAELADAFEARKGFAYGRKGGPARQASLLKGLLSTVDLSVQALDSIELGVTAIDHYVDTLGGVSRAVSRARGAPQPVYISDQTQGAGKVRSLAEQVTLETHTRTLNPRWYEGQLRHGYEGVRQIEAQVTNTMGWSATTGVVEPWVYERITETFVTDTAMRDRLGSLNPKAAARLANRLLEANARNFWQPDAATLQALHDASDAFEDQLERVAAPAA